MCDECYIEIDKVYEENVNDFRFFAERPHSNMSGGGGFFEIKPAITPDYSGRLPLSAGDIDEDTFLRYGRIVGKKDRSQYTYFN